jgi:uncharacterized membrane protein HdeD (DUF308 family)
MLSLTAAGREDLMFTELLSRYWWMTMLRGVIWICFGLVVFAQPGMSLVALISLFGAFALVDGVSNVIHAVRGRHANEHWVLWLIAGGVGIGIGLLTFFAPQVTALTLLF